MVAGFFLLKWEVGIGGGDVGGWLSLQVSGSLWMTGLDLGSLFRRVAYLLVKRSAWNYSIYLFAVN